MNLVQTRISRDAESHNIESQDCINTYIREGFLVAPLPNKNIQINERVGNFGFIRFLYLSLEDIIIKACSVYVKCGS